MSQRPDDLITASEAAGLAHVHVKTMCRWLIQGVVPGWRLRSRWFVSRDVVLSMFRKHTPAADPPNEHERDQAQSWVDATLEEHLAT